MNYKFQFYLYNNVDEKTEFVQCLRLPIFLVHNISSVATFMARTAAIAETFFNGCGMLLMSSVSNEPRINAKKGMEEAFSHTAKNILRLAVLPLQYLAESFILCAEPKAFVIEKVVYLRVDLKHAMAKTLGSEEHDKDQNNLHVISYNTFRSYQKRTIERAECI